MQEYVKIKTDRQTSELLKQVRGAIESAIESAIVESMNDNQINENLKTLINNHNEFPNFDKLLNEQLVKINTKVENVAEHNLSQITSKNELNRNIIIDKIVTLFDKILTQDKTLSNIHLLQKEIEENSKPIEEIKKLTISNYDSVSKKLDEIQMVNSGTSQSLNKVSNLNEQIAFDNAEIKNSINLILSKQDSIIERINTIETIQNKPWYKKIIK